MERGVEVGITADAALLVTDVDEEGLLSLGGVLARILVL